MPSLQILELIRNGYPDWAHKIDRTEQRNICGRIEIGGQPLPPLQGGIEDSEFITDARLVNLSPFGNLGDFRCLPLLKTEWVRALPR
jgi:hypothetical protein